jgi:transcriptional regulator with XRE-family HTH domain
MELREETGVSRASLARAAKLTRTEVTRIETEERTYLRFQTVCRLATAFGITTDEIAARAGLRPRTLARDKRAIAPAALEAKLQSATSLLRRALDELGALKERIDKAER